MGFKPNFASLLFLPLLLGAAACQRQEDPGRVLAGTWKPVTASTPGAPAPTMAYRVDREHIRMVSSTGESYDTERGGTRTPVRGAPPGTTVRVWRVPVFAIQEIYKRDGKTVKTTTVVVVDGKTALINDEIPAGSATVRAAVK